MSKVIRHRFVIGPENFHHSLNSEGWSKRGKAVNYTQKWNLFRSRNNSFIKLLFLMLPLLKLFVYKAWEIKYLYLSFWLFLFLLLPDFLFSLILRNSKINPGCLSRWNMWEYVSFIFLSSSNKIIVVVS